MRRRPLLLTAGLMATALTALSAQAALVPPPTQVPVTPVASPVAESSPNVTHVGTIPVDAAGVSAKIVTRPDFGGTRFLYVSNVHGFDVYDFTDPAKPGLVGRLPLYNWENEALSVSKDGKTALISEFTGTGYTHIVDVSNPNLPMIKGSLAAGKNGTGKLASHVIVCADDACNWAYGSEGPTYDFRDKANPKVLPQAQWWGELVGKQAPASVVAYESSHALEQDSGGNWIVDMTPMVVFRNTQAPGEVFDPTKIARVTTGKITKGTNYQHNSKRPRAHEFVGRAKSELLNAQGQLITAMRPGELVLGEGESNFTNTPLGDGSPVEDACGGTNGALWSGVVANPADAATKKDGAIVQLEVLRPVTGPAADGNAEVNALGCSGHWFDVRGAEEGRGYGDYTIAASWYEHGTRIIKVDPATGKFTQVGFFQPIQGSASSTYWVPGTDYIITIDYQRGIDILKFNNSPAAVPTPEAIEASWLAKLGVVDQLSALERELCKSNGTNMDARRAMTSLVG